MALEMASNVLEFHAKKNIRSLFYQDADYPRRLSECVDAPTMLFQAGSLDLNRSRFVAIVGTRNPSSYGKELTKNLVYSLQDSQCVIVSGLASGIDAYAHRYCLDFDIPTIGVLGHGLDRVYPATNRNLARKMLEKGSLVTEFPPGTNPDRENFPKRNRIVAGLCDATIVVESKKSGGSLITANLANGYNRDVFAFPGNVTVETSQGCNSLISANKAHLLESPEAFAKMMEWNHTVPAKKQMDCFPELSEIQQEIASFIGSNPKIQVDLLAIHLALPISRLQVELFQLKLSGVVEEFPGKQYSIA